MQIIIFKTKNNRSKAIKINGVGVIFALSALIVSTGLIFGSASYFYGMKKGYIALNDERVEDNLFYKNKFNMLKQEHNVKTEYFTKKIALISAQLDRINTLGNTLTKMAKLDKRKFNFSSPLYIGGKHGINSKEDFYSQLDNVLDGVIDDIDNKSDQLYVLNKIINKIQIKEEFFPSGRPAKGTFSSPFGKRLNPFTRKEEMHPGFDIANKEGADILAVGSGIVKFSGKMSGYGNIIVIEHADGYESRYAHNSKNFVKKGEVVRKGQIIAAMGSTGHSTGPHVHLEILKNNKKINPYPFIIKKDKFYNKDFLQ
ncbi:MAG: hypothetical protein CMD90_02270 [Gammaproteobacteria bacterium]|nr:hypothetical protein [Gammaproteobacteria bacterium]|tara:strand:- start:1590 stop:2528 length:939 start_codon:yes stop_codon:yes gene_type:complete